MSKNPDSPIKTLLTEIENELLDKIEIAELLVGRAHSSCDFRPREMQRADALLASLRRVEALLDGWHIAMGDEIVREAPESASDLDDNGDE